MKEYYTNGDTYNEDEIDKLLDVIADPELFEDCDNFNDFLDENYARVDVCGEDYNPSEVLIAVDEDKYYDMLHEWAENEAEYYRDEYESTLNNMDDGEEEYFNGIKVSCRVIIDEDELDDYELDEEKVEEQSSEKNEAEDWNTILHNAFVVRTL